MSQSIRDTIVHLCTVLHDFGIEYISPETMRLAKFNDTASVSAMLRLTHDMIILQETCQFKQAVEPRSLESIWTETVTHRGVPWVQEFVLSMAAGYGLTILTEESRPVGSRELLVLFAWFCAKFEVLECWSKLQFATSRQSLTPFPETTASTLSAETEAGSAYQAAQAKWAGMMARQPCGSIPDLVDFSHSLLGMALSQLRDMVSQQSELTEKLHKLRHYTRGARPPSQIKIAARDHLHMFEVFLLRNKRDYMSQLKFLEAGIEELQNILAVRKRHHVVLWKWFDSARAHSTAQFVENFDRKDLDLARRQVHASLEKIGPVLTKSIAPLFDKATASLSREQRKEMDSIARQVDSELSRAVPNVSHSIFERASRTHVLLGRRGKSDPNVHEFVEPLEIALSGLEEDVLSMQEEVRRLQSSILRKLPELIPVDFVAP